MGSMGFGLWGILGLRFRVQDLDGLDGFRAYRV